jgi:hypothetical protein
MRNYDIVSPSLEGVLIHGELDYKGLKRPLEVLRVLDGPSSKGGGRIARTAQESKRDNRLLEEYFHDLYGIFMRRFSQFVVNAELSSEDNIKLQALLQELIKVKRLVTSGRN